jgi:hypothetical protein
MRIRTYAASVALIVMSSASFAQSINPGVVQLAHEAGVNPAAYTQAQIVDLIDAQRDNDPEKVAFILSQSNQTGGATLSSSSQPSQGLVQLAKLAGVQPGAYTQDELIRLRQAQIKNHPEEVAYILNHEDRVNNDRVNPGKAQLAKLVGVNPADYTLAQLDAMNPAASDN